MRTDGWADTTNLIVAFRDFSKEPKAGKKCKIIQNYHNEYKSTLTQERVHTDSFHFHDTAHLEFDLYQIVCEIRHTYCTSVLNTHIFFKESIANAHNTYTDEPSPQSQN